MAEKLTCPSCGGARVRTRRTREFPDGRAFRRRMPLVRILIWVPVLSVLTLASWKLVLAVLLIAGTTAWFAAWGNARDAAATQRWETHTCRRCGSTWKHVPGDPEPAPSDRAPS
jgi:hypothetical protein